MIKNALHSVDCASLVFAHTVLEDGIDSFIELTSVLDLDFWRDRVKKKQVEIETILERDLKEVMHSLVRAEIGKIRRNESLVKKSALLFSVCKLSPTQDPEYTFDSEKLKQTDKLRQDVIHGDLLGSEIAGIEEKLVYLRKTWLHFFKMMHERFGLRLDTTVFKAESSTNQ